MFLDVMYQEYGIPLSKLDFVDVDVIPVLFVIVFVFKLVIVRS